MLLISAVMIGLHWAVGPWLLGFTTLYAGCWILGIWLHVTKPRDNRPRGPGDGGGGSACPAAPVPGPLTRSGAAANPWPDEESA